MVVYKSCAGVVLAHGFGGTMPSYLITRVVVIGTRGLIYHNPQAEEQREDDMVDSPDGSGPSVEDAQMGVARETHRDGHGPPEMTRHSRCALALRQRHIRVECDWSDAKGQTCTTSTASAPASGACTSRSVE